MAPLSICRVEYADYKVGTLMFQCLRNGNQVGITMGVAHSEILADTILVCWIEDCPSSPGICVLLQHDVVDVVRARTAGKRPFVDGDDLMNGILHENLWNVFHVSKLQMMHRGECLFNEVFECDLKQAFLASGARTLDIHTRYIHTRYHLFETKRLRAVKRSMEIIDQVWCMAEETLPLPVQFNMSDSRGTLLRIILRRPVDAEESFGGLCIAFPRDDATDVMCECVLGGLQEVEDAEPLVRTVQQAYNAIIYRHSELVAEAEAEAKLAEADEAKTAEAVDTKTEAGAEMEEALHEAECGCSGYLPLETWHHQARAAAASRHSRFI